MKCPLCKRVVKIVPVAGYSYKLEVESHTWVGVIGDFVDRLLEVQWRVRCPMSNAPAEKR